MCEVVNLNDELADDLKQAEESNSETNANEKNGVEASEEKTSATTIATDTVANKAGSGKTSSSFAHRPKVGSTVGNGVRGKGSKNNLYASLETENREALMENSVDNKIKAVMDYPSIEEQDPNKYMPDPEDSDLYDIPEYIDDTYEDDDEYKNEGYYELHYEYDPQIDMILNELDRRLEWTIYDGMCSRPVLEDGQIIIDCDHEAEVRAYVRDVINEVCEGTCANVEEDGYTTVITFDGCDSENKEEGN